MTQTSDTPSTLSRVATITWGLCVILTGLWCLAIIANIEIDWQLWLIGVASLAGIALLISVTKRSKPSQ